MVDAAIAAPPRLVRYVPVVIVVASVAILGAALGFQYIGGLHPCALCIYQRIPYGVTIALGLVALVGAGRLGGRGTAAVAAVTALAALTFAAGAGVAAFHVGVEQGWWHGLSTCSTTLEPGLSFEEFKARIMKAPTARCDEVAWSLFGVSMAGYNFLLSLALAGGSLWAARRLWRTRAA